jgi:hypothetical protein
MSYIGEWGCKFIVEIPEITVYDCKGQSIDDTISNFGGK